MIRSAILAAALLGGATAAQAAPDCRSITTPGDRLKCYDAAAAPAPGPANGSPGKPLDFAAYPAKPYQGPVRLPSFTGPSAEFKMFRTRIRDGMREGPNFAGHLAIIQFGCGTGCSVVLVGDVATGGVSSFPLAGEDVQALGLDYKPDSNLVRAEWQQGERCMSASYAWTGSRFEPLVQRDIGPSEKCS